MSALVPQQPTLRAFVVFDTLPAGCIPFLVTDERTAPLLRPGDVAVIDTSERSPAEHELSLIRWNDGRTTIVEAWTQPGRYGCGPNGEMIDTRCWYVAAYDRPRTNAHWCEAIEARPLRWGFADGPYATEGPHAGALSRKLVGRVVGILEPRFAEPMRTAGEVR